MDNGLNTCEILAGGVAVEGRGPIEDGIDMVFMKGDDKGPLSQLFSVTQELGSAKDEFQYEDLGQILEVDGHIAGELVVVA